GPQPYRLRQPGRDVAVRMRAELDPDRGGGGQREVGRRPEPVSAARGPDPQHRRVRAGRGGAGAQHATRGHRSARGGDADHAQPRAAVRPRSRAQLQPGAGPALHRADPAAPASGGLSGPQDQPEFPGAAIADRGNGEPDHDRARRLQPGRAGLQHAHPHLSRRDRGEDLLRCQAARPVRGRHPQRRPRAAGELQSSV
ncbi:MAG: LemA family protein, partial [uncultured Sphingomonadaceae bacterium]